VAVVQQAMVALCHLDDPVHIASHNTPVVPAVAGVVAVLRFPLYLLVCLLCFMLLFGVAICLFYIHIKKRVATLLVKHIIIVGFWLVSLLIN